MIAERIPSNFESNEVERKRKKLRGIHKEMMAFMLMGVSVAGYGALRDTLRERPDSEREKVETLTPEQREANSEFQKNWEKKKEREEKVKVLFEQKAAELKAILGRSFPKVIQLVQYESGQKRSSEISIDASAHERGSLDAGILKKILNETFPKHWVEGEIDSISLHPDFKASNRPGWDTVGEVTISVRTLRTHDEAFWDYKEHMDLYGVEKRQAEEVLKTLSHELGHANDWIRDEDMTPVQRADLLLKVIRRVQSDDRFHSSYVESLEDKNPQEQLYDRACEYWAEISAAYFDDPESLNIQDYRIVDEYVKATDPKFENRSAHLKRLDLAHTSHANPHS